MNKKIKVIGVISGFLNIDLLPVRLSETIIIRRITDNEELDLFQVINCKIFGRATCPYSYVVEVELANDEQIHDKALTLIRKIEQCLQLFFITKVNIVNIQCKKKHLFLYPRFNNIPTDKKELIEYQSKLFVDFWNKFIRCYDGKQVVFTHFSLSLNASNNDKFIYWTIVLESLFVPKKQRLKKDFILHGLNMLNLTKDIEEFKDIIDTRNAIVHANLEEQRNRIKTSIKIERYISQMNKLVRLYVNNPWNC